jgi:hypothetical protein
VTRTSTIVTLAVLSSILTPVVVKATGTTPEQSATVQQAKVEVAAVTTPAIASEESPCGRRVKVVYASFAEVHAAACSAQVGIGR